MADSINSLCQPTTIGLFYKLVYYSIRKCSYAWPLFELSLVSFSPLNTYIARYARVRRTEIYCAIARKLSHPTPKRVPSSLLEWPRCEGGRLVKLIYRTSLYTTLTLEIHSPAPEKKRRQASHTGKDRQSLSSLYL